MPNNPAFEAMFARLANNLGELAENTQSDVLVEVGGKVVLTATYERADETYCVDCRFPVSGYPEADCETPDVHTGERFRRLFASEKGNGHVS